MDNVTGRLDAPFFGVIGQGGRGAPDGKIGLTQAYSCVFGRFRLSVWTSVAFVPSDGQCVLLSGRIFGQAELQRELGTESADESALLLYAYREWGDEFPNHVHGDYAFVLWDANMHRLLLGRDPLGFRPLYFSRRGSDLIFASGVSHLLNWPGLAARPNERHIARWLALAPEPTTETFFEDIFRLLPGTMLSVEDERILVRRFWQPESVPLFRFHDSREYVEGVVDIFERAVRDRVTGTSPMGSQLSGGLDSSSVTVTAARLLCQEGHRLCAFTAVPEHAVEVAGRFTDEGPLAAAVAASYPNIDHVLVTHGAYSTFFLIDLFNAIQEEPILNPSNYGWAYEICRGAQRRGIETLLIGQFGNFTISYSGDGALQSLLREGRVTAFARLAQNLHREGPRRWLSLAHEVIRPWMPIRARHAIDRLRGKFSATHEYSMIRQEFALKHELGLMMLENDRGRSDNRALRLSALRRPDLGPFASAFRQLTGVGMSDPTGDRRVIEYCLSVPVEYYCEKGVPRSLIRNAMIGRLPEQVRSERHKGLQTADFSIHFEAERAEALAEVGRMRHVDLIAHALDLPAMETMLQMSPPQADANGGMVGHWPKLLRALSLGRFLRRLECGTLFSFSELLPSIAAPADQRVAESDNTG